jgi:uncharacterized protein YyaL (SSP411 family)
MSGKAARNRLAHETSPYLLQHAGNPVDWYPWGEAAHARARAEDKPILLSIGYSACHWCHVMEHESFEDEATARVMNELFINIKVDREERPDLDRIYQTAHQVLAGRPGGWPLTMFLAPDDHAPFFGGTYFPNRARHGLPAFTDLLQRVAAFYREHRDAITEQNSALRGMFARFEPGRPEPGRVLDDRPLAAARRELESHYDPVHGGFGGAPKFPHPMNLEFLLRAYAASVGRDVPARSMATDSLRAMIRGGLYDQLGGGFCRYSVDERWMIPHFEKMLYDNGPLLALTADVARMTSDPLFARAARETGDWVMREMQSPAGGYYATLDADSEGHEGRFYVWTPGEVEALLTAQEYRLFAPVYGLDRPPNFENKAWHLHAYEDPATVARRLNLDPAMAEAVLGTARAKLMAARNQRVRPGRDEKIITGWNGLMIRGMARAGRVLGHTDLVDSASRALDFIRANLWRDDRLLASFKDGRAVLPAYLDDYAFLMDGVLELLQARWRSSDLAFLTELAETLLDHFEDKENGGFFFTADDHERLIHRPKPLGGARHFLDAAERTLHVAQAAIERYPSAHCALLAALAEHLHPPQTVVLRGPSSGFSPWIERATARYAPARVLFAIPETVRDLPAWLGRMKPGTAVEAHVCTGVSCAPPAKTLTDFETLLASEETPR